MTSTHRELRERALAANLEIPRRGLAIYTFGNVSAFDAQKGVLAIKPSGVPYERLSADDMVVVDLEGKVVEGRLRPSSDTPTHVVLYSSFRGVAGIVHTHSTYATAWAARGEAIPCVLTMMGDEFGGTIPVGPFALIGDDSIGRGIVETLQASHSPAVLMQNHGPFTIGKDARSAVKAAVMCEEVARTVHIARQLGEPLPIDPGQIESLYDRYQNVYGR